MTLLPMPDGSDPDLGIPPGGPMGGYQFPMGGYGMSGPVASPLPMPSAPGPGNTLATAGAPTSAGSGDLKAQAMAILQKYGAATPANLERAAPELAKLGISIHRNAEGIAGKIVFPGGEIDDVIANSGAGGGGAWQMVGPGSGGGNTLGGANLGALTAFMGNPEQMIEQTPGYGFLRDQAVKAFDRSAAAHGTLLSGGYPQALGRYITSMVAGPAYDREMQYLSQLSALGFNAANQTGGFGGAFAANAGNIFGQQGNAAANATIGSANAGANATNAVMNGIGQITWPWNKPKPPVPPPTNTSYTPGQSGSGIPGDPGGSPPD